MNKHCPFCGSTQLSTDWDGHRWLHIACNACEAHGPAVRVFDCKLEDAEKRAFAEWNWRVQ